MDRSVRRLDAEQKINGTAKYISDIKFDNMLYAITLRSDKARAKIISISFPVIPEGYYIVDKNDVILRNKVLLINDEMPFFADGEVNYIGEPILLVVGPDKQKVFDLISAITVNYKEKQTEKKSIVNLCYSKGDPDGFFRDDHNIIEEEYQTPYQEQLYLEPQGVVAEYKDNKIIVYGSLQCPYYVHKALHYATGWEKKRIRVKQTVTGGAFGGKEDYPSIIAGHAAFAAVKTGHPVQVLFDRSEDLLATPKRHPSYIKIKTAYGDDFRPLAMKIDISIDGGAYEGLSSVVLQRAMFAATGVYKIPNVKVKGEVLKTNTVPNGAFRGFGAPQSIFAIEKHMETLAGLAGLDPLDYKLKYILKKGDETSTGGTVREDIMLPEIIEKLVVKSDYRDKRKNGKGIGIALFVHGCGFTGKGEEIIQATVKLRKNRDNKVEILVANVEMGQGAKTTLTKIVADTLDIPLENVIYEEPDTDKVPDSGPTVASRTVLIVGGLLEKAALELKKNMISTEYEVTETYKHPEYIKWDQEKLQGDAYLTYSWGANVVELELCPLSYEIKIKDVWAIYDFGKAIDERIIKGQIDGGILQGLGFSALEHMFLKDGAIAQTNITDYSIPSLADTPHIKSSLVDNPFEYGPKGAKCAGEATLVGVAPALVSAIENIIKRKFNSIPVYPEKIMEAIYSNGKN